MSDPITRLARDAAAPGTAPDSELERFILVQNFFEELKARVPN